MSWTSSAPSSGDVLVVDDYADTRGDLRSALERDGWMVVEAGNGRQALDQVALAIPHVVLLDLDMPVMDGFAFLARFREEPGCAEISAVLLTASDLMNLERKRLREAARLRTGAAPNLGNSRSTSGRWPKPIRTIQKVRSSRHVGPTFARKISQGRRGQRGEGLRC